MNPYPISDELRDAGWIFREEFRSLSSFVENEGVLYNGASVVDGGLELDGVDDYATIQGTWGMNGQGFVIIRFTPDFNWDADAFYAMISSGPAVLSSNSLFLYKQDNGNLNRLLCALGTGYVFSDGTTFGSHWHVGEENTITVSLEGTSSKMWLNGVDVTDTAIAQSSCVITDLYVGRNSYSASRHFDGTIHSVELGCETLTDGDIELFDQGILLENIRTENSILSLPAQQVYERASDSKTVTPLLGRIVTEGMVAEALMGSDGTTASEFPTLLEPRGFSFDGSDDCVIIPYNPLLGFGTDDFSVAVAFDADNLMGNYALAGQGDTSVGEWMFYLFTTSLRFFGDTGNLLLSYALPGGHLVGSHTLIATRLGGDGYLYYDGELVASQASIGSINLSSTKDISIGSVEEGTQRFWPGNINAFQIGNNRGLSPVEARALSARLLRRSWS